MCNSELGDVKGKTLCYPISTHLAEQHQSIPCVYLYLCAMMSSNLWQDKFVTTRVVQAVWSSIGAVGAFSFTELIPFIALALVV